MQTSSPGTDPALIKAGSKKAKEFVEAAILAVRNAAEPNPWKTASDEDIAGEILKGIEAVEAKRKTPPTS